jgi:hypothetical protein
MTASILRRTPVIAVLCLSLALAPVALATNESAVEAPKPAAKDEKGEKKDAEKKAPTPAKPAAQAAPAAGEKKAADEKKAKADDAQSAAAPQFNTLEDIYPAPTWVTFDEEAAAPAAPEPDAGKTSEPEKD